MRGAGRIFQRGGVWWIAYYHRGREIRESAQTTSERKAGTFLRERLRTAGRPDFIGPAAERVTFDDLATMYLTDYRVNGRRSLRDATRYVETLRATFGLDRALDITADRITAYADARRAQDHVTPATVNRELGALRRMFSLATRAGKLAACEAVGVPGLLFHDLRRSGARNYRRAQVTEDVIMRIGGWKTPSMFRRCNVVDERDLTEAAERLSAFLTGAASASPTIVPLAAARAARATGEHGQNTDNRGTSTVAPAGATAVSS